MIRSSQHGFTKSNSRLTRLIAFCAETTTWRDEGSTEDIFYLDISKAFDTVSHEIPEANSRSVSWMSGQQNGFRTG